MPLPKRLKMTRHVHMGDVQLKPGVPMNHLQWINQYTNELGDVDLFVDAGDFNDMHSLSYWDRGKLQFEGRRVKDDFACGVLGLELLHGGMKVAKKVITVGNHEYRIDRAVESQPELQGFIDYDNLQYGKYYDVVNPFRHVYTQDGVAYSHFFQRKNTPNPVGGTMLNQVKTIGYSFVAGHSPGLQWYQDILHNDLTRTGMVNGACYLHYEDYKGKQDNQMHFRGIVVLNEVDGKGGFLPMPVSLEYLCRRYENMTLKQFAAKPRKWITYGKADKESMRWLT